MGSWTAAATFLTFTADRKEGSVSVEKRFSPTTLLVGRYSFRRVLALDISERVSPEQIPLLSRPARIGMLGTSYLNDHRDDPADATQGSYSLVDTGVSWRSFGSEANFLRLTGQNATYYRLGSHLVFARNTRFGVESPFGGLQTITVTTDGIPTSTIPTTFPCRSGSLWAAANPTAGFLSIKLARGTRSQGFR